MEWTVVVESVGQIKEACEQAENKGKVSVPVSTKLLLSLHSELAEAQATIERMGKHTDRLLELPAKTAEARRREREKEDHSE